MTFAEKAAARQLPAAEFALGYFHEVGIGAPINLEKAKRWYERVSLLYVASALQLFSSSVLTARPSRRLPVTATRTRKAVSTRSSDPVRRLSRAPITTRTSRQNSSESGHRRKLGLTSRGSASLRASSRLHSRASRPRCASRKVTPLRRSTSRKRRTSTARRPNSLSGRVRGARTRRAPSAVRTRSDRLRLQHG